MCVCVCVLKGRRVNALQAMDSKLAPEEFVEDMKRKGTLIPGIGHRIKSARMLTAYHPCGAVWLMATAYSFLLMLI